MAAISNEMLTRCLEDLERRLDPAQEQEIFSQWREFVDGRHKGEYFDPARRPAPASFQWPKVLVNEALVDFNAMAVQQLAEVSEVLAAGRGNMLDIRANFGTCIMPSLFGVELFRMDDELDTLPTNLPLSGGVEEFRRLVERGVPSPGTGLGGKCLETGPRFVEMMKPYPNVSRFVHVYHPDMQGPMDVVELLWGSGIFLDIVDSPDLVKSVLETVSDAYISLMRAWDAVVSQKVPAGYSVHWGVLVRGHIMLRNDSAVNFSPAMYEEFIRPYDEKCLLALGGGGTHFCGRGDHFVEPMSKMRGLNALTLSQPHLNDMEKVFRNIVDKGIVLFGLPQAGFKAALASGRPLRGLVHVGRY